MAAVVLICACKDDERAHEIGRRLAKEGHDVRVAHREIDIAGWAPKVTVALWSRDSKDVWSIRQMANHADAKGALVHVKLDTTVTPPMDVRSPPIVDLSRWRGEAAGQWRLFREKIERAQHPQQPAQVFYPSVATVMVGVTIIGFTTMMRVEDGPGSLHGVTTVAASAANQQIAGDFTTDSVGGPEVSPAELEPDLEVSVVRAQPMRFAHGVLPDLELLRPIQSVEIRRVSLLRQILSVPEHIISGN